MGKVSPIQTNFTSGELSPLLDGRVDISRYYNGCKTLENFIVLPYGGIKRRPGTYYISEVIDSDRKSRLIPFQFSIEQAYIVELGDRTARFYANQGQMLSGGAAYEITTPYLEADLFDLQIAQDADTRWMVHPSYKPRKLTRAGPNWDSYTKLMLHCDGADASTTFTDSATAKAVTANGNAQIDTAQYKFNGASGLFDGTGDYLSLADSADFTWNGDFTVDFQARFNTNTNGKVIFGHANNTFGTNENFEIIANVLADTLTVYCGAATDLTIYNITLDIDTWYHIAVVRTSGVIKVFVNGSQIGADWANTRTPNSGAGGVYIGTDFNAVNFMSGWLEEFRISKGIARWTANFTPPTSAYAADVVTFAIHNYAPELLTLDVAPGGAGWAAGDIVTGQASGETCEIVEVLTTKTYRVKDRSGTYTDGEVLTNGTNTADQGAGYPTFTGDPFGADGSDNCPSCVTIHEQRICFANTNNDPQKVWASVSGDYEDMTVGTGDSDAFVYTIGSEQVNAIRWLSSGRVLGMGTLGGVFSLSSGDDTQPITPTNVVVKRETSYGALGVVPKKIGNQVYYIQRNGKTIREFAYSYDLDEYTAFDATLLAEHITNDEIVDMDYQQSPYNMLWCVRNDGEIAVLTRQIDQEVLAWSRIVTDGEFESVAVIPGDGGDDEVWVAVKRTIGGVTKRYIEYFKPMDFGDEQEDAFFVDSGLTLDVPFNITDITQANPGVVTTNGIHGLSNGNIVIIRGVVGMTEVNQTKFKVANKTDNTFELTDVNTGDNIDTSAYTAYSSGGEVRKCVTSVSGLSHLAGKTVDILVDGVVSTSAVVTAGGAITIADPVNGGGEMHAGLEYTSTMKTMRIEAGSQQGTAQSKLKRISKVYIRVYESIGMNVGNEDVQDEVPFDAYPLFSGDKEAPMPSLWDRNAYIMVIQDDPLPLTIIALIIWMTTEDA